jgi:5-methylcytosine-specific restriction enzyme subunit McrC
VNSEEGKVIYSVLSRQAFELDLKDVAVDGRLDILPHVEEKGLLFLQFRKNKLIVTPGAYIGLIPLTPKISFDVRPKLPVSNLARVIDAARRSLNSIAGTDRLYLASDLAGGSILDFLAANLVDALRPIITNGVHKNYVRDSEPTSHPRGRIDVAGTMRGWSRGQFHKVQAQRFEQSSDVPVNRLIKGALAFVLRRMRPQSPEARKLMVRANAAYMELPQVISGFRYSDYSAAQEVLRTRGLPAGRSYYYRALEIALLILSNRGIALLDKGADVLLETFIINFDDLFEEYLRRVLQMRTPTLLTVRDGNHEGKRPLFDDRSDQPAQPDVVLTWQPSGRSAIGEIKYKERPSREDINQAITYALCYDTDRAVLIHQTRPGSPAGLRHHGTIRGIRLENYSFNLGAADLEAEETAFAEALFDLVRPRQTVVVHAA